LFYNITGGHLSARRFCFQKKFPKGGDPGRDVVANPQVCPTFRKFLLKTVYCGLGT
jgi:hypothetical protein